MVRDKNSGERVIPDNLQTKEEYIIYLKHLFAYKFAKEYLRPDSLVLEVGCGEGYGASYLSDKLKMVAIDVDRDIIERAKIKYVHSAINFMVYDGINLPFNDDYFDAVISFQVIEHIKDDKKYIQEIYRVLERDGVFIVTTPNKRYRLGFRQRPWNVFHIREYNAKELKSLLKTQFTQVELKGILAEDEIKRIELYRLKGYVCANIPILTPLRKTAASLRERLRQKKATTTTAVEHSHNTMDFTQRYKIEDFFISDKDVEKSLDLVGICQK
jgi:ubiquinone/menaquinone biosynthesis C-methylase UbiE